MRPDPSLFALVLASTAAGQSGTLDQVSSASNASSNGSTVITAGSTWNFQAWFRDSAAGNSGFSLSDAYEITFLPCLRQAKAGEWE